MMPLKLDGMRERSGMFVHIVKSIRLFKVVVVSTINGFPGSFVTIDLVLILFLIFVIVIIIGVVAEQSEIGSQTFSISTNLA